MIALCSSFSELYEFSLDGYTYTRDPRYPLKEGRQGVVCKFQRSDDEEGKTTRTPKVVAVKIESLVDGREEQECYHRVRDGKRCEQIARLRFYEEVEVEEDKSEHDEPSGPAGTNRFFYSFRRMSRSSEPNKPIVKEFNKRLCEEGKKEQLSILVMDFYDDFTTLEEKIKSLNEDSIRQLFIGLCW